MGINSSLKPGSMFIYPRPGVVLAIDLGSLFLSRGRVSHFDSATLNPDPLWRPEYRDRWNSLPLWNHLKQNAGLCYPQHV